MTLHARPVPTLGEFESHVSDEGGLGRLDAGSFMGGMVDTMLGSFRREVEEIEEQVDRLDEVALRGNDPAHFLERVVALRRRAAISAASSSPSARRSDRSPARTSTCTRISVSRGPAWSDSSRRRSAASSAPVSCSSARPTSISADWRSGQVTS